MRIPKSRLDRIREEFAANFAARGELGASVSIWLGETELLDLHGGFRDRARTVPWDKHTIAPVWSATKGPASACVLLALHAQGMHPETATGEIWPELGRGRLRALPVGDLLAHRGGLCALDATPSVDDYPEVIRALEDQEPLWELDGSHGYQARTFGFLADELVRRLTGQPLGAYWRNHLADDLELDLWIGLPPEEDHRVAEVLPPPHGYVHPGSMDFYRALAQPDSLTHHAFRSPRGMQAVREVNLPESRRLSLPSLGGIGSARALARFYAVFANGGRWSGRQILPTAVCEWAEAVRCSGRDRVLLAPTAFSAGFMKGPPGPDAAKNGRIGPSPRAFGHPGAGGVHAFADPGSGIAFAYVMNQMERSVFPTAKALSLVRELYLESGGGEPRNTRRTPKTHLS